MIADADPRPTYVDFNCEIARLANRIGDVEAARRIEVLADTAFHTTEERQRYSWLSNRLGSREYTVDDSTCGPGIEVHHSPQVNTTAPASNRP
jgi:hypothetical protein